MFPDGYVKKGSPGAGSFFMYIRAENQSAAVTPVGYLKQKYRGWANRKAAAGKDSLCR